MTNIEPEWITAAGTVLSSLIATTGAAVLVTHRRTVISLAREVEAYHKQEGWLVEQLIKARGCDATSNIIIKQRGILRSESGVHPKPVMTGNTAKKIRKNYFCFD